MLGRTERQHLLSLYCIKAAVALAHSSQPQGYACWRGWMRDFEEVRELVNNAVVPCRAHSTGV